MSSIFSKGVKSEMKFRRLTLCYMVHELVDILLVNFGHGSTIVESSIDLLEKLGANAIEVGVPFVLQF